MSQLPLPGEKKRLIFKLKTLNYEVMPLPLDLCRLSSTVANGVQVFLQRLFHVVKINGLRVGASEWHEVTVSSLQLDVLFDCSILFFRGRVQAVQELLFFITNCILAIL